MHVLKINTINIQLETVKTVAIMLTRSIQDMENGKKMDMTTEIKTSMATRKKGMEITSMEEEETSALPICDKVF